MRILPKTKLGKWSFALILVFILGMLVFFGMVYLFNQRGGDYFYSNFRLSTPILIAAVAAAASFITGMISFFLSKERALLVFLSVLIGLLVSIYMVMEFSFPH